MSRRCRSAASGRAPLWSVLLLVLLLAVPLLSSVSAAEDAHDDHAHEGHDEEEPPLEHIMEVYDKDGSHSLNAIELKRLFTTLQEATSGEAHKEEAAAADAHAGHAHGAPAATPAAAVVTETLAIAEILEHYTGDNPKGRGGGKLRHPCLTHR
jgi:hypothetical protein